MLQPPAQQQQQVQAPVLQPPAQQQQAAPAYPVNVPVQLATKFINGIAAMWGKPAVSGIMNNRTPLRLFTAPGTLQTCVATNCSFKIVPNSDGSVSIQAADGSGVLAMWGKRVGTSAAASQGLFMYNGPYATCAPDGCSFMVVPAPNGGFTIAAKDGTGYVAVRTPVVDGADMYMDADSSRAAVFDFPSAA